MCHRYTTSVCVSLSLVRIGRYGSTLGLSTPFCTGSCSIPGYYCPSGSSAPWERVCGGDDLYCPPLTPAPILVDIGWYTADYAQVRRMCLLRGSGVGLALWCTVYGVMRYGMWCPTYGV
ncbi:hypothetical protein EON63_23250 [archaeon]|nr:MAG: hypothetical protein EON63_23250 [archaeon]